MEQAHVTSPAVISNVWSVEIACPLTVPLATSTTRFAESRALLVVVEDSDGSFGVGEVGTGHLGRAHLVTPALKALIEGPFRSLLVGRALNINDLNHSLYNVVRLESRGLIAAAIGGLDIAFWDLQSKRYGRPLCEVLGGAIKDIPVYATGGHYRATSSRGDDHHELTDEMLGYVARGFTAVKMKVGGASAVHDGERVAAVRQALGPETGIAVDASYALTPRTALELVREIAPYRIDFLEAPVALYDTAGLAELRGLSVIPIAGNEFASTVGAFSELISRRCVDLVQPSLTMCGGITEAMKIVALAAAQGLPVTLQSTGSAVAVLASLHFAAAFPQVVSTELNQIHAGLFTVLGEHPVVTNGAARPPCAPGLGITEPIDTLRELASREQSA